ncbi:hypothetical protein OBBRIDRAFT_481083 [Obba rivulosa]|uniref:Uncharacterized protein n=1 Tax=Obba rivulosa TaxID=1052685 RepID=A0A8E2AW53_9APHY|nr:hypothetical protein OBBRIDRAFT_481083 [Obba rivulosa]
MLQDNIFFSGRWFQSLFLFHASMILRSLGLFFRSRGNSKGLNLILSDLTLSSRSRALRTSSAMYYVNDKLPQPGHQKCIGQIGGRKISKCWQDRMRIPHCYLGFPI